MVRKAFDLGITHFDLANNYGPPPGSAEENFGKILKSDFASYRDELVISTKAGYGMWPGPYGDNGSRKYLLSSLHQSLKRMNLEYVDIFYHHRPDAETPLEESMTALSDAVKQGKALYAAISNYPADLAAQAIQLLNEMGTPCLIHQARHSLFERDVEHKLLDVLEKNGVGFIAFSPLGQGMLSDKYLHGIPADSRAANEHSFLKMSAITPDKLNKINALNDVAKSRNQSLAQMAISWLLAKKQMTSVLIGASKVSQVEDCVKSVSNSRFSDEELAKIESILAGQ
jgi:L-glyceraldehyde 3-phosphate reductase